MAYRRVLEGYTPPLGAWTHYRIEEATYPDDASATVIHGPAALSPAITDQADPPTYTFTTLNASRAEGWYRVVWLRPSTDEASATTWNEYRAIPAYAPSAADIASILRTRAVENGGHAVTVFTDQTNPTVYEVQNLIAMHVPLVFARFGRLDNLGCSNATDLRSAARTLAAQRVALEVESSYWPEEVTESASVEMRLQMWTDDVTALVAAMESCRASGDDGGNGGESDSRMDPAWRFPFERPLRF